MIKLAITIRTPRLTAIRKALADSRSINEEICQHFLREIDRNITRGGIWEKFPPNKPSTTAKRLFEGKDPKAMFGLRGRFKYSVGKTQFSIFSNDPDVTRMHFGPSQKSWIIAPKGSPVLAFPVDRVKPRGRKRAGSTYDWYVGGPVTHHGWERRVLLPPAVEVSHYSRQLISQKISEAG